MKMGKVFRFDAKEGKGRLHCALFDIAPFIAPYPNFLFLLYIFLLRYQYINKYRKLNTVGNRKKYSRKERDRYM